MRYPKSLYKDSDTIVVWSPEEHAARTADGWSDEKTVDFVPFSELFPDANSPKPLPPITMKRPQRFRAGRG